MTAKQMIGRPWMFILSPETINIMIIYKHVSELQHYAYSIQIIIVSQNLFDYSLTNQLVD